MSWPVCQSLAIALFGLGNSSDAFLLVRSPDLGFSGTELLLLYAAFNLMPVVLAVTIGRLSDQVGRQPLLVAGYGLFALVYLGFAVAQSPVFIWVLFVFYGLHTALTWGVQKALVAGFLYTWVSVGAPFCLSARVSAIAAVRLARLKLPPIQTTSPEIS